MRTSARGWPIWTVWGSNMKPKFKLGDKVKFSRVAYREMTLLAAENDPKPWYDVKWVSQEAIRITKNVSQEVLDPAVAYIQYVDGGRWRTITGEQQGVYVGTRTKQSGLIVTTDPLEDLRQTTRFKRLGSVPCGLVVTDVRKNPILVLIKDLEHV